MWSYIFDHPLSEDSRNHYKALAVEEYDPSSLSPPKPYRPNDVCALGEDCILHYCGNVVQWAEVRYGIRGSLRFVWPSGLMRRFTVKRISRVCRLACPRRKGSLSRAIVCACLQNNCLFFAKILATD
ncbi:unnamed protein product [Protopolystoma xenopodis]|uniref:Uncharacterized protein n=1 Tax=Protopolystoma xenopodis TaxID=117903 RepID=A0A448WFI7_9PLAT|nr:unnamed protein product [Protopolystoma xenopodis]